MIENLYYLIINLYLRRFRAIHINRDAVASYVGGASPCLLAAWHGDMYYCSREVYRWRMYVMASRSNFGSVASAMLWASGNTPIRGGSNKGGKEALEILTDHIKAGGISAIIADAPRGPYHESKIGPVLAAARTGAPIVPVALAASRRFKLPGWDRGWFPKPFSRVAVAWGDPIFIPSDADHEKMEKIRVDLTETLLRLGREAEMACDGEKLTES